MKIRITIALVLGVALSACSGGSTPSIPAQPQSHSETTQAVTSSGVTITPLPLFPGRSTFIDAFKINNNGLVVGRDCCGGTPYGIAVKYQNGVATNLGGLPGYVYADGDGVNDGGTIVGDSCYPAHGAIIGRCEATRFDPTGAHDMGHPSNQTESHATAINSQGIVVGFAGNVAIEFRGGRIFGLGPGEATGINDAGVVVGWFNNEALMYSLGCAPVRLNMPAGTQNSMALGINNYNVIAGVYWPNSSGSHPFVYSQGRLHDIGLPPGGHFATDAHINNEGWVAGTYSFDGTKNHGFLYRNGHIVDLTTMIPTGSGWTYIYGIRGLNDRGDLVGVGIYNGQDRNFIMHIPS